MDIATAIGGLATFAGITGGVTGMRLWVVSHGLKALEIEAPRATAVALSAYADAISTGRTQIDARAAAVSAARVYLYGAISGPLLALRKTPEVVNTTANGVAAQALSQAATLGLPTPMTPLAGALAAAGAAVAQTELERLGISGSVTRLPTKPTG